jgi:hypothetical protein
MTEQDIQLAVLYLEDGMHPQQVYLMLMQACDMAGHRRSCTWEAVKAAQLRLASQKR